MDTQNPWAMLAYERECDDKKYPKHPAIPAQPYLTDYEVFKQSSPENDRLLYEQEYILEIEEAIYECLHMDD